MTNSYEYLKTSREKRHIWFYIILWNKITVLKKFSRKIIDKCINVPSMSTYNVDVALHFNFSILDTRNRSITTTDAKLDPSGTNYHYYWLRRPKC